MTKPGSFFLLLSSLALALSALLDARRVLAQSAIELKNVEARVEFGQQITFLATVDAPVPLQNVSILLSDELHGFAYEQPLAVQEDGRMEYRLDTQQNALHPFATVQWRYRFTFGDGTSAQSQSFSVRYADDRFPWQSLESGALRVSWYVGEASFGRDALRAAQAGLESIGSLTPADLSQPVEIFIYAGAEDLQSAVAPNGETWIVGHADPALGIALVAVEPGPGQSVTMEQRIPHELMHVMLYRRVGLGYARVPAWLREGMSTYVELSPTADYGRALSEAASEDRLIPLKDLCVSFPPDAAQAFLAYAESRSFITYLHDTYGSAGLLDLALAYANGADCERGPEHILGASLTGLEHEWHSAALAQYPLLPVLQGISPYLVLLCLILVIPFAGIWIVLRSKSSSRASPHA